MFLRDPQCEQTHRDPLEDNWRGWEASSWVENAFRISPPRLNPQNINLRSLGRQLKHWPQHWVFGVLLNPQIKMSHNDSAWVSDFPDDWVLSYISLVHPEQREELVCFGFNPCAKVFLIGNWLQNLTWNSKNQNVDFHFVRWLDGRINIFRTQYIKLAPQKMNFTVVWIHLTVLEPKFNPGS